MRMPGDNQNHKDLIHFAFSELTRAINDAKNGKPPTGSYDKLKQAYDTLSAAEKKKEAGDLTDEEMQATLANEVEKLKGDI